MSREWLSAKPESFEACLMLADISNFTAYQDNVGAKDAACFLGRFFEIMNNAMSQYKGVILREQGDGFYAAFPDEHCAEYAARQMINDFDAALAREGENLYLRLASTQTTLHAFLLHSRGRDKDIAYNSHAHNNLAYVLEQAPRDRSLYYMGEGDQPDSRPTNPRPDDPSLAP